MAFIAVPGAAGDTPVLGTQVIHGLCLQRGRDHRPAFAGHPQLTVSLAVGRVQGRS
jgi:hypothetical protein